MQEKNHCIQLATYLQSPAARTRPVELQPVRVVDIYYGFWVAFHRAFCVGVCTATGKTPLAMVMNVETLKGSHQVITRILSGSYQR